MITVILKDGSETTLAEWQKIYNLPVGSESIGRHFTLSDPKLAENLKQYGKLVINELLIRVLDVFREKSGIPCILNAFNRSEEKQKELQADKRFAAAGTSPHVYFMAADINAHSAQDVKDKVAILLVVGKELGIKIRIGYQQYLNLPQPMTFVHVDVCPEYYGVGKPYYSRPHPKPWENQITW